jgi:hypothetical protein
MSPDALWPQFARSREQLADLVRRKRHANPWAKHAMNSTSAPLAQAVFTRRQPATPATAAALRIAALCLAAEAADLEEPSLAIAFREIAAGTTVLQWQASGELPPTEIILLTQA